MHLLLKINQGLDRVVCGENELEAAAVTAPAPPAAPARVPQINVSDHGDTAIRKIKIVTRSGISYPKKLMSCAI